MKRLLFIIVVGLLGCGSGNNVYLCNGPIQKPTIKQIIARDCEHAALILKRLILLLQKRNTERSAGLVTINQLTSLYSQLPT